MTQKNKTTISFISTIQQCDEKVTINNRYEGDYVIKNNIHYLRYYDKESHGITLKYSPLDNTLTILWQNHAVKKMIFSEKNITQTTYHLPQGQLLLNIVTKKVSITMYHGNITKISLHYHLLYENELFGQYNMEYAIH
ncbi:MULTISPECIES: DUF1934 domain-containing protein [unclassified Granulicatella]|uniref:DUF1934 domain-containing protein n=1 Tax=unclassified Granulicatella TaxID=2630493 RepID=UPI001072FAFA|nr:MULTISPECIES: DUF1934 domain-containing protein [unclassified Granulicatella]MBF0781014.1 DUF1934 family protein [Granulicatella sp. 19428wC4_WM01]TFU92586.1 DUF1934 domain-containing protein [Granulicatella sp. WM01]